MRFDGKKVAVTGAAGNLGQAVAAAFLAEGATAILIDQIETAISGVGPSSTIPLVVDLTDAQATRSAFDELGPVDVLCNVAGGFDMGTPVAELEVDQWEHMFDINARTAINASRAAIPGMIRNGGGAIVNVSAKAALAGGATMAPYAASKSVVMRLTESMAAELKSQGINVNCVLPTALDTPQNRAAMPKADTSKWVDPGDLAAVILFLASPAARAVHGAAIPVSGLS
jgi:NAD(P)-dependent dehydrogenase (short-subunit alcohol dehydrogenase family)